MLDRRCEGAFSRLSGHGTNVSRGWWGSNRSPLGILVILVIFELKSLSLNSTSTITRSPLAIGCFKMLESATGIVQVCPVLVWKVIVCWA